MMLPHLATRLYNTPLLIQRAKLDAILTVLGDRVGWNGPQALVPTPAPRALPDAMPGIALIPVYGSLVRRSLGVDAASGLTAYSDIAGQIDLALADPRIEGILLDVDSPGGEAGGVFELGERIRLADAVKPIWALASDSAFSAAYAIACGASRLIVSRTGGVGSIGVIALHVDQSLRDAQDGYRFTAIYAGEHKNDFSPHAPLTDSAATRLQAEVDRLYGLFVSHVAMMRGMNEEDVRATQAGLFFGPEAVEAGLADIEGSLDSALMEFTDYLATQRALTRSNAPLNSTSHVPCLEKPQMNAPEILDPTDIAQEPGGQAIETTETPDQPAKPGETPEPPEVDKVQVAVTQAKAETLAIAELCQLAGQPQRIAGFLAEGASPDQVRQRLLAIRAESPEIASRIHPDAQGQATSPESGPLMKAVRRMIGQ
jgi:signal peptide peptidase SppA